MTITKDVSPYIKNVKAQIVADLQSAKIRTDDVTAGTQVLKVARAAVDAFVKKNGNIPPSVASALLERALGEVAREMQGEIADLIAKEGGPRTQLKKAGEIKESVDKTLGKANPAVFDAMRVENADAKELASVFAALAPLAAICGAPDGHNHLFAERVESTAAGDVDMSKEERAASGMPAIETRQTQMPFAELRDLGVDTLMMKALAESAQGIQGVFEGLVHKDAVTALPTDDAGFLAGVQALQTAHGAAADVTATYAPSPKTMALLERLEHQLRTVQEVADRDTSARGDLIKETLAKPELALAKSALMGAQVMYVKSDLAREKPRLKAPKHFDQLSGHRAARNLPVVVAAIEGAKLAARIMNDIVENGVAFFHNMPSEDAFYMQRMLEATARWAITIKDPQQKNEVHATAVAMESSLSLVTTLGHKGDDARKLLPGVTRVLKDIALASGDHFIRPDGQKASASSLVAMERAGELLAALHPGAKRDWQAHALDLKGRASVQDIAKIVNLMFGRDALPTDGVTLRTMMADRFAGDEYFISHVTGKKKDGAADRTFPTAEEQRAVGKKALSDDELRDYAAILFACNVGWKQGQVFRGEGDRTRVDSTLRDGVFDSYENLVRARGDALAALYVVLKDGWEALDKGEKLEK